MFDVVSETVSHYVSLGGPHYVNQADLNLQSSSSASVLGLKVHIATPSLDALFPRIWLRVILRADYLQFLFVSIEINNFTQKVLAKVEY